MIQKLLRQFGEHGNDYSPIDVGDKINEIIDYLMTPSLDGSTSPSSSVSMPESELKKEEITAVPPTRSYAVRSTSTADKVYLIKDGKKYWIKNPETLMKLGFKFSDVKSITNEEMAKFPTGEPINLKEPTILEVKEPKDDADKYNL